MPATPKKVMEMQAETAELAERLPVLERDVSKARERLAWVKASKEYELGLRLTAPLRILKGALRHGR